MGLTITWGEGKIKGHAANCVKVQCLQQNYSINTNCRDQNCFNEMREMPWGLTSESVAIMRRLRIHTFHYTCIIDKANSGRRNRW